MLANMLKTGRRTAVAAERSAVESGTISRIRFPATSETGMFFEIQSRTFVVSQNGAAMAIPRGVMLMVYGLSRKRTNVRPSTL